MATIRQKSWGWEAQILRRGRTAISRTFRIKADASAWAIQVESEIARGVCRDRSQGERFSLDDTLVRYRAEVTPCKKSAQAEEARIDFLRRDPIACLRLSDLRSRDAARFRDRRLQEVTGSTVIRDLILIPHAINIARKEWGIVFDNPCSLIRRHR